MFYLLIEINDYLVIHNENGKYFANNVLILYFVHVL